MYDEDEKTFTIMNSRDVSIQTIQQLFAEKTYRLWEPKIQGQTDWEGNKMVKLVRMVDNHPTSRNGRPDDGLIRKY